MKKASKARLVAVLRWLITILGCAGIIAAFAGYKINEVRTEIQEQAERPEYFETVQAASAETVNFIPTVKTIGTALAAQRVELRNELSGYITQVNFKSGAAVKRGQVIIQLDISEQQAKLDSASARAELALIVHERHVELHKSNSVSKESVERSLAELKVIKAEIAGIRSAINRKTIRAPFSGVIGIHQFETGHYLDANTSITTLVGKNGKILIDFSLPQLYHELRVGTLVSVRRVHSQSSTPKPPFKARIEAGNSVISPQTRSRLYRAVAEGLHPTLIHNVAVEVDVPVGSDRELIAIPSLALQSSSSGQYVFVLTPEPEKPAFYRANRLPVSVEHEEGDRILVAGKLQANQLVAAAGAFKLKNGVLVKAEHHSSSTIVIGEN